VGVFVPVPAVDMGAGIATAVAAVAAAVAPVGAVHAGVKVVGVSSVYVARMGVRPAGVGKTAGVLCGRVCGETAVAVVVAVGVAGALVVRRIRRGWR